MIALIPYVRETFRRHLNSKQAVMLIEFDKLKRVSDRGGISSQVINHLLLHFLLPRESVYVCADPYTKTGNFR